jgi:hypothetical protein
MKVEIIAAIVSWIGILYLSSPEFLKWLYWDFSGIRFVWEKINSPKQEITGNPQYKKPATFFIWVVGLYVAFFGIASQRYENRIDKIENRANAIFAQLSSPSERARKGALSRISRIQNMSSPYKPDILRPSSVFLSFFKDSQYDEMVSLLIETVENWRDALDFVNLEEANLRGANLTRANLVKASLREADLREADLWEADLRGAKLIRANLEGADLRGANLQKAFLVGANMASADLKETDLRGAILAGAINLSIKQISMVKTLYGALLNPELWEQVKKDYPHLLKKAKDKE